MELCLVENRPLRGAVRIINKNLPLIRKKAALPRSL